MILVLLIKNALKFDILKYLSSLIAVQCNIAIKVTHVTGQK